MTDAQLLESIRTLAGSERRTICSMLRRLAEIDKRRLYLRQGYSSLFNYCRRELRLSESETGRRIAVCRKAAKFPVIFDLVDSGELSLTALALLAPHLERTNYRTLLKDAAGKSLRELDRMLAPYANARERRDAVRHLAPSGSRPSGHPTPSNRETGPPGSSEGLGGLFESPGARTEISAVSAPAASRRPPAEDCAGPAGETPAGSEPARVEIRFTADQTLLRDLERAREILGFRLPSGRIEHVLREITCAWLERNDPIRKFKRRRKKLAVSAPRIFPGCRKANEAQQPVREIPAGVKAAVYERDGGRCRFISNSGVRCGERSDLQYDHIVPFARGGRSDNPDNIRLLFGAHNRLEERRLFGDGFVDAVTGAEAR